ncbi:magnesium chelatase subunit H [Tropicimonas sp. IMCC34043]|uniref:magnesium chelatase subunit H n=1 Tax=Tropicimonas sp. IMCC34043 TaxID=2248760 RepID=UPI000E237BFF|nr:magnesium chelatase subunit H [Tropicimonas sp. IMCC34043]
MRDEIGYTETTRPYRVVIVTLDAHAAGPVERAEARLAADIPGLRLAVHAAAEWAEDPSSLARAKRDVAAADILLVNLLFFDEHVQAILPDLEARRANCDAFVGYMAAREIVNMTRLGSLDMSKPATGAMKLLKRLRGTKKPSAESGEKQMRMLRRLPRVLKYIPGTAQDLRAFFLTMQYWLGGSDDNIEALVRFLVHRYAKRDFGAISVPEPIDYPEVGLYHPDLPERICQDVRALPRGTGPVVGLLLMRSYVLAGDTAHYDTVIRSMEARGLRVIPAFAAGLDGRPAMDRYFISNGKSTVDTLVSLTGFSLVGGPAYNDSHAAEEALAALDVPYVAAHPLEFQTLGQWNASTRGLGPVETTMLIALPEIDGATGPTVIGGRHGPGGCPNCTRACAVPAESRSMAGCPERCEKLAARVEKLARLRRSKPAERKLAVVLYGFPPNAGAVGTAAYLAVFESLHHLLISLRAEGYAVKVPESVDALRDMVLGGNAATYGQAANVAAHVSAEDIVSREPHLNQIEAAWGPAPGRIQCDGCGVFVLGADLGNVFVGVQPVFGYEGDPMRLLFEEGFAPTHAFSTFYRYLREDFGADVLLHFGMHGALEFMPGKQAGPGADCWPDRLIGDVPHIYLYASNNPSEATLAKRRTNAVTVTHLTPPLAKSGLYKGLQELRDTLGRWRQGDHSPDEEAEIRALLRDQAEAVDIDPNTEPDAMWLTLLETEDAMIPDGMHVLGATSAERYAAHLEEMDVDDETKERMRVLLGEDHETPGLLRALGGHFVRPVAGGDLIRSPEILPTGRNLHAFDPFRMPTALALAAGRRMADKLLEAHGSLPRTVALVLWGSDNIKSDGGPIGQALALMGARPRFDGFGRLAGAELIPLEALGRPRIDVIMTLSGIFRDLLPLQTKLLAEAAWLAATADEPLEQNFIRAHALAYAEKLNVDLETAALRVFSNAEGAYGANVNQMIDAGTWSDEDELADVYERRKGFAYGRSGKAVQQGALLKSVLKDVDLAFQNLESVELGVTTVDHYFDTLGGISRAVKRARGESAQVYIGDETRGNGKVRTLQDQVALESRSRALNPRWYEGMLKHGHEGVRQIEAQVTNTLGWSATTNQVDPWVYKRLTETFVLDPEMRRRLAQLNPTASARVANRLLEAHARNYWQPDDEMLEALQRGSDELEDNLEGLGMAAE